MKRVREGAFSFEDKVWKTVSDDGKEFIRQLLTYNKDERPSAEQALVHPWLQLGNVQLDEALANDALMNLEKFNSDVTLKMATFAFIASQLMTKEERENLSKVFNAFDKDGDGKLSMEEVKDGYLEHYGKLMSDEEVQAMFDAVDTDHSGYIDYTEFIVAATS